MFAVAYFHLSQLFADGWLNSKEVVLSRSLRDMTYHEYLFLCIQKQSQIGSKEREEKILLKFVCRSANVEKDAC